MAKKETTSQKKPNTKQIEFVKLADQAGASYLEELKKIAGKIAQKEPGKSNEHYLLRAEYRLITKRYEALKRSESEFADWKIANLPE
jgi:hypothetical protein